MSRNDQRAVELVSVSPSGRLLHVLELDRDGKHCCEGRVGWPEEVTSRPAVPIRPGGAPEHVLTPRPLITEICRATSDFRTLRFSSGVRSGIHPHIRNRRTLRNTLRARAHRALLSTRMTRASCRAWRTYWRSRSSARVRRTASSGRAISICSPAANRHLFHDRS